MMSTVIESPNHCTAYPRWRSGGSSSARTDGVCVPSSSKTKFSSGVSKEGSRAAKSRRVTSRGHPCPSSPNAMPAPGGGNSTPRSSPDGNGGGANATLRSGRDCQPKSTRTVAPIEVFNGAYQRIPGCPRCNWLSSARSRSLTQVPFTRTLRNACILARSSGSAGAVSALATRASNSDLNSARRNCHAPRLASPAATANAKNVYAHQRALLT